MDATDNPDEIDPATGLRRRLIDQQSSDPVAPATAPAAAPSTDAAPFVSQWDPGSSAPNNAPAGQHWDANMANYVPDAAGAVPAAPATGSGRTDRGAIAAQVAQWASMPGADPSLASNPDYWVGRIVDTGGLGPDNQQYWQDAGVGPNAFFNNQNREAGGGGVATTGGGGQAAASGGGQVGSSSGPFDAFLQQYQAQLAAEAAQKAQVREFLLARLKEASAPVNENDQNIAAPLQAARDETARSTDTERTALAERLYAQGGGLNSNALTQGIQQSSERNAGQLSSLRASLISNEYNARRTQMTQLLQQALSSGNTDAAQQIQVQIAALNAALQREGLGANLAMFGANLNQQAALAGLNG